MNRYQTIPIVTLYGKQAYLNNKYPEIPLSSTDTYVITVDGDRFDTLANQYYGNPSMWWVIAIANTQIQQDSMIPPTGTQIRIPANGAAIVQQYQVLNTF